MGSIDTLEIKCTLSEPSRLVLYAHRRGTELVCPVDEHCINGLRPVLRDSGATYWLRSISREVVPFFGFWHRYKNHTLVVRIKHGTSRREVTIPCGCSTGERLLAVAHGEWSDTA